MKIVFAGSIGRLPVGGHAWVDMNYMAGLVGLGHDVYYLEECGPASWVYNWETEELTTDLAYPSDYVRASLDHIRFGERWIYRAGDEHAGMAVADFEQVCAEADLLLIRGCAIPLWRSEYSLPRSCTFIDSDPGFTQIKATGVDKELAETVERANRRFTIGQRVGDPGCEVPLLDLEWEKTLPPAWLPMWPERPTPPGAPFSSVLQWHSYAEVHFGGRRYGNKDLEFPAYMDLPARSGRRFRIALTGLEPEPLTTRGWEVVPGWVASATPDSYQAFIADSRAEFAVAKHGYVAMQAGWFSDRSVCYLASGRPVVVQDTGLDWLAGNSGVLSFSTPEEATAAVRAVTEDYAQHAAAARATADDIFSADRVLPRLLDSW